MMTKIERLRVENRKNPLGIQCQHPVFGWNVITETENYKQISYEIIVRKAEHVVWDSKVVQSDKMVQIPYEGELLESDTRYDWKVRVEGSDYSIAEGYGWFETGLLQETDWKGNFIGEVEDKKFHIYRKTFKVLGKVKRARLYICGLGHYECEINGNKVSDAVLEPGWTDYDKTCFYSSLDVTHLLQGGKNGIGIKLGDGMFNLPGGRYVYYERTYGKMKVNVQLNMEMEDGTKQTLVTDDSWKMAESPIVFCCMYGGEDYDARLEQPDYSQGDFVEDERWEKVNLVDPPKGKMVSQMTAPLKVMKSYEPIAVIKNGENTWLYDLGTNFSGWARIRIRKNGALAGSKIIMTPGEILDKNGVPDQKVTGRGYAWTYIMNEKAVQEFAPDFTYTGFRYVQIMGASPETQLAKEGEPVIEILKGEFIYPDIEREGSFQCSENLFNQIHQIICQAILSNMKGYLTDCPHRERLGWLEQTHLIAPGVMYNFDVQNLYQKQEQDMMDAQHEDGLVPDIAPEYVKFGYHKGFVDSPEWGSACIIDPWYLYQRYNDTATFTRYYDTMKSYIDYLTSMTHHGMLHHGLGDWLDIGPNTPYSQNTPVPVVATSIYYYDLTIMAKIATILGKKDDQSAFETQAEYVKKEYNLQYFDNQTSRYATGSQAAQALSLVTGLVPEEYRKKVIDVLRRDIEKRDFAITAGDVGHPFLITAAIQNNLNDLIYNMTIKTDTPGYGYQIVNGATTLTEEWDGPKPDNQHGSQNHFMLGGIEEWFYGALGGIRLLHEELEYGHILIKPYVPEDMKYCNVSLRHPYGQLESSWKKENGTIVYRFVIPANSSASIEIDGKVYERGSGIWTFSQKSSKE